MKKENKSLEEIIKGCINHNSKDQEAFFNKFAGRLMAVSQRVGPNDNVANDILQDGFIKIFRGISTLKIYDERAVYAWCKTVITNTAIDFYRKEKRYSYDFNMDDDNNHKEWTDNVGGVNELGIGVDEVTYLDGKNISADKIIRAIQNLTPSYKLVFNMIVMDGLSHEEISDILNISAGTSKSNLSKAKERLRKELTLCN